MEKWRRFSLQVNPVKRTRPGAPEFHEQRSDMLELTSFSRYYICTALRSIFAFSQIYKKRPLPTPVYRHAWNVRCTLLPSILAHVQQVDLTERQMLPTSHSLSSLPSEVGVKKTNVHD